MSNNKNENIKEYAIKLIFESDNEELKTKIKTMEIIEKIEKLKLENDKLTKEINEKKQQIKQKKIDTEEKNKQKEKEKI